MGDARYEARLRRDDDSKSRRAVSTRSPLRVLAGTPATRSSKAQAQARTIRSLTPADMMITSDAAIWIHDLAHQISRLV
jgi:hypothetical protein